MADPRWFPYLVRERHLKSSGINKGWWVTHQSYAKENQPSSEMLVTNEWICSSIGAFLRLPIPPFAVFRRGAKSRFMFGSLRFGSRDSEPDDCRPLQLIAKHSNMCTGIVVFDALIANRDRHVGNIRVNDPLDCREFHVFDHDRALLGFKKKGAVKRLEGLEWKIALEHNSHCLAKHLDTSEHFKDWLMRVRTIPAWFITEICEEARRFGITVPQANRAKKFLLTRRTRLHELIDRNHDVFPRIKLWRPLI